MTKTNTMRSDQAIRFFERFEFLSFGIVSNFDIAAFALKTLRASKLIAGRFNCIVNYL